MVRVSSAYILSLVGLSPTKQLSIKAKPAGILMTFGSHKRFSSFLTPEIQGAQRMFIALGGTDCTPPVMTFLEELMFFFERMGLVFRLTISDHRWEMDIF